MRLLILLASLLRTAVHLLVALVGEALGPSTCAACDARLPRRAIFCAPCAATLTPLAPTASPPSIEGAPIAFGGFGGALAVAVRRFKYGARPDLAAPLGHLARRAAIQAGIAVDLVVPVPLHPRRLAERGYNQAALIAGEVASALAVPLAPRALRRVRNTPPQARLQRAHRLENMIQAFLVRTPALVRDRRVLLIDDVATTGATLDACRAALLDAGASAVTCLVVARADREDDDYPSRESEASASS